MRLHKCLSVIALLTLSSAVLAAGFQPIGVVTAVPAIDVTPAGSIVVKGYNTLEVTGRVTAGTGNLHLLRKVQTSSTHFQFRPWAEDRSIDVTQIPTDADGYFSARFTLPDNDPIDEFAILNPGGAVTIDGTKALVARGHNY